MLRFFSIHSFHFQPNHQNKPTHPSIPIECSEFAKERDPPSQEISKPTHACMHQGMFSHNMIHPEIP
ncbi:hypothetical protein EYC84_007757 [Monilinia fructicola]|uniref:Uncharacterized protein n=1 Tax=Monilinia fructicola TaxID=38448 RepID=A0A5M9JK52_MONFR|nr:hypothetical protein EYC84_007757 [Monilinia fructicola]